MIEELDYVAMKFWFDVLQLLGIIIIGVYTWLVNRHRVTQDSINEIKTKVGKLENRMIAVEKDIEHLPNDDDLERIHDRVNDACEKINKATESIASATAKIELAEKQIGRFEQYLLNRDK